MNLLEKINHNLRIRIPKNNGPDIKRKRSVLQSPEPPNTLTSPQDNALRKRKMQRLAQIKNEKKLVEKELKFEDIVFDEKKIKNAKKKEETYPKIYQYLEEDLQAHQEGHIT